ncbi:MAG: hypothetical protein DCF12_07155 [Snowella sp.]|nr:MAG: hypothetical protein DCF12_07155 [Snowella sp.]
MKNETFSLLLLIATIVNLGTSQSTKAQSIPRENVDFSEGNSELGSKIAGEMSISFDKDKKLTGMDDRFVAPVAKNPPPLNKRKQIIEFLHPESSTKTAFYVNSGFTSFNTSLEGLLESRSTRVNAKQNNQNLLRKAINQSQSIARINQNTRKPSFSQGEEQSFLTPLHPFFKQKDAIASTPPPNEFPQTQDLSDRKKDLKIDPLDSSFVNPPRTYSPSLTFTFSAFGANWGDLFIGGSVATAGNERSRIDSYGGFGFGLGNASNLIGSTVSFNMQSLRNFGATNGINVDFHRIVFNDAQTQVAMAVGVTNLIRIYSGGYTDRLEEGYWGAITSYTFLRPDDPVNTLPLALTVGGASGQYDQTDVGIFGGVGIQLAPQLGVGAAWSGVSLDLGMSYVPIPTFPLTLTMEGIDLTNNTPGGPRFLFGINVGYNFSPRGY